MDLQCVGLGKFSACVIIVLGLLLLIGQRLFFSVKC